MSTFRLIHPPQLQSCNTDILVWKTGHDAKISIGLMFTDTIFMVVLKMNSNTQYSAQTFI